MQRLTNSSIFYVKVIKIIIFIKVLGILLNYIINFIVLKLLMLYNNKYFRVLFPRRLRFSEE